MMGRLTFIPFLIYSLSVGMHHLFMDPEHGAGFKFLQMSRRESVPTRNSRASPANPQRRSSSSFSTAAAMPASRTP
jgi:hypothetical protein